MSSYSPIGSYSITRTELKYENVHKAETAQNSTKNTKQLESQQKFRLGTISNIRLVGGKPVLQAPNPTLIPRSGSQHSASRSNQ